MASESKEIKSPSEQGESLTTVTVEDALHEDQHDGDNTAASGSTSQSTSKSKKKKKSKLKALLSHKKDAEVALADVADAISSTTAEEKRTLTADETAKLEAIIRKMNMLAPGGRKDMGDHKFWKTQPVLKFGMFIWVPGTNLDEIVSEEGQIEKPQPDLVRKEPLPVPGDFEFVEMDMTNDTQVCIPHGELLF